MRCAPRQCVVANGFRWEGTLEGNLADMEQKHKRAMVAGANYAATQIQSFMRSEANWTDRSGNARSGLKTKVVVRSKTVAIVLYHSVPYGIWLEVRWGGKYAIIKKGMAAGGPLFMETVGRLMFK
jgi:hypothetical protein